jgi:hypothetical protein
VLSLRRLDRSFSQSAHRKGGYLLIALEDLAKPRQYLSKENKLLAARSLLIIMATLPSPLSYSSYHLSYPSLRGEGNMMMSYLVVRWVDVGMVPWRRVCTRVRWNSSAQGGKCQIFQQDEANCNMFFLIVCAVTSRAAVASMGSPRARHAI